MFSIRNKLILLFGGTALLVTVVVLFFGIKNVDLFEKLRTSEVKALFSKNVETINRLADKSAFAAHTISAGANVLRALKQTVPQYNIEPQVHNFLTNIYNNFNESAGGGFWFEPKQFDPQKDLYGPYVYRDGEEWNLNWEYNTPENSYLKQDWYLIALPETWDRAKKRDQEIYWTAPYVDPISKITMITADAFIHDTNGHIIGISTVDWEIGNLLKELDKKRITPGTESFMVDTVSNNIVLYTPDPKMNLQKIAKIDWLNTLPKPTTPVNLTTTNINNIEYRVYYAETNNGYLYGIMTPEDEFMPGILAIVRYGEMALGVVFLLMLAAMLILHQSIATPLEKLSNTVIKLGEGDYLARTNLAGNDELSRLGEAFDQMLDERVSNLVSTEQEKAFMSVSIIKLLEAVSQLSQRDLTVKVPVTEDVTGPVADALNLLTEETAKVLRGVIDISEAVADSSSSVKNQSDAVIAVAEEERHTINKTASDLAIAADDMQRIALLAQNCNTSAETAIETTQQALQTVTSTVEGINNTRDTIRETEKRIKRLGERSQDITGVVNLINTIAERTHILALNASMHAASAGQAGRGFAVVANEVQRLAENAREATSRISTLVSNIQIETVDTANAINAAINQVVDGSKLAELAGEQMKRTEQTTAELVEGVRQISERSQEQASISVELLNRTKQIQASTQQTSQQLKEQNVQTNRLVAFAQDLVNSVRVFKLPY